MSPTANEGTKPVPPYSAVTAVADQVPDVIIPAVCIEEKITPVPNVLLERTEVPFILYTYPEERLVSPATCNL